MMMQPLIYSQPMYTHALSMRHHYHQDYDHNRNQIITPNWSPNDISMPNQNEFGVEMDSFSLPMLDNHAFNDTVDRGLMFDNFSPQPQPQPPPPPPPPPPPHLYHLPPPQQQEEYMSIPYIPPPPPPQFIQPQYVQPQHPFHPIDPVFANHGFSYSIHHSSTYQLESSRFAPY